LASLRAVETAEALDFIRSNHHAVLATTRGDGGTQQSPVSAGVDARGRIVVSSREAAVKVLNLRRRPHAWLCVFPDGFYGNWVQVEGPAEVISLPEAMDELVAYYRSISGEHPDWDDYRRVMTEDRRVIIAITVVRAGPSKAG
jgi:PPOX class probable F420-dependent enzyme